MREIKFRVWNIGESEFVYWGIGDKFPTCLHKKYVMENMKQYTGEKDKHGNDIYEGCILKTNWMHLEQIAVVEYKRAGFTAKYISSSHPDFSHFTAGGGMDAMWWSTYSEIIGNTDENEDVIETR